MSHPEGAIPRVERQPSHKKFVQAAQPSTVEMKLNHARRLWKDGVSFAEYFGEEVDVMTSTTMNDQDLRLTPWKHEFEYIRDLEPEYHIAADYSDYADMDLQDRVQAIKRCMEGTSWIRGKLREEGVDTNIIPLVKGITREEREICYAYCDAAGIDTVAAYAVPYFSAGNGNNITALEDDISEIQEERPDLNVVLIGMMSPLYLSRLSDNVVAAAGRNQWRTEVRPRKQSEADIDLQWGWLEADIVDAIPGIDEDRAVATWDEKQGSTAAD